jgi:hypothetical protein
MFKFKITLVIAVFTVGFIFTNTAQAKGIQGPQGPDGQQGPIGKTGPVGSKGLRGDKGLEGAEGPRGQTGDKGATGSAGFIGNTGQLNPLSQIINCGDSTALVGVWFGVVNGVSPKSTQECSIKIDASRNLTGYCHDIQKDYVYVIKNGSATFDNQCVVSFNISYTNGATSTSRAIINKAGDTLVGTYKNNYGDYGTFSAIPGDVGEFLVGMVGPAGGVVFYSTDSGRHGLEAAPVDQSSSVTWGCINKKIGTSMPVGSGAANTAAIIAGCKETNIAAKIADDYVLNGYSDWFLPSSGELYVLYQNKDIVGNFTKAATYWSSTELDSQFSYVMSFLGGDGVSYKTIATRVRAIRYF